MTNAFKVVVWDAYYWPYGETRSITGTATLNLRFPGQYFLAESGLHYNRHRHYDPTLGCRYLQPDPLRDVLATRPVNLDESGFVTRGGKNGGAQFASVVASSGDYNAQIGVERLVRSRFFEVISSGHGASVRRTLSKLFPQFSYWRYSVRIVLHESSQLERQFRSGGFHVSRSTALNFQFALRRPCHHSNHAAKFMS